MCSRPAWKDEVLVFAEAHLGVLRAGLSGELRTVPPELLLGRALEEDVHERLAGGLDHAQLAGVAVRQGPGVLIGPDPDRAVHPLVFELGERVDEAKLLIGGRLDEDLVEFIGDHADERMPAGLDHLAEDLRDERLGRGVRR